MSFGLSNFNGTKFWTSFCCKRCKGLTSHLVSSFSIFVWAKIFDSVSVLIKSFVSSSTKEGQPKQRNDDVFTCLGKNMTSTTEARSLKVTCTPKSCEDNSWEVTHLTITRSTISELNLCSVWENGLSWCWSQNAKEMGQRPGNCWQHTPPVQRCRVWWTR